MSAGDGVRCPACDGDTGVVESRPTRGSVRRRRRCLDSACAERVTTVEVVAPRYSKRRATPLVAVPRADSAEFAVVVVPRRLLAALREFVDLVQVGDAQPVAPAPLVGDVDADSIDTRETVTASEQS